MLIVENVSFAYQNSLSKCERTPILHNISFRGMPHQLMGITGPSGSGKTTLLGLIAGWLQQQNGTISINGMTPQEAVRQRQIGLVQQNAGSLLPNLTVEANIALPLVIKRNVNGFRRLTVEDREKVRWALELAHIAHARYLFPSALSGGMAARAMIARAIVDGPSLLLFDEAFSNLDDVVCEQLYADLQQIMFATNVIGVVVSHRLFEVIRLCTEVVVLRRDHLDEPSTIVHVESVPFPSPRSETVVKDPRFVAAYDRIRQHLVSI